jgi:DNA repair ATPase RecN
LFTHIKEINEKDERKISELASENQKMLNQVKLDSIDISNKNNIIDNNNIKLDLLEKLIKKMTYENAEKVNNYKKEINELLEHIKSKNEKMQNLEIEVKDLTAKDFQNTKKIEYQDK